MTGGEIIGLGKAAQAVGMKALGQDEKTKEVLLRVAEDTPEMKAAARTMAARIAVKERVKLKLWEPFARMVGVSKEYFEETFPQEIGELITKIPEENLITPAPSVAVPALRGLSYTFGEPNLKELYLQLLATASDNRIAEQAHPSFAEIITQLAPREAKLLTTILNREVLSVARIHNKFPPPEEGSILLVSNLICLENDSGELIEEPQAYTWIDNWQRLGLIRVGYDEWLTDEHAYDWVEKHPKFIQLASQPDINADIDKGIARTTDFGRQFLRAVTD